MSVVYLFTCCKTITCLNSDAEGGITTNSHSVLGAATPSMGITALSFDYQPFPTVYGIGGRLSTHEDNLGNNVTMDVEENNCYV